MPIYEYRCGACGHKLESLQRLSDAPMVTCPSCGKDALTKLVSAAGFQLKGSGWYATDFKNSGAKPPAKDAAKTDTKADTAASASGEAKSDSAPKPDTSAASPSAKSGESAKSETRSASDKPTASGTTSGS